MKALVKAQDKLEEVALLLEVIKENIEFFETEEEGEEKLDIIDDALKMNFSLSMLITRLQGLV